MNTNNESRFRKLTVSAFGLLAIFALTENPAIAAKLNNQLKKPSSSTDYFRITCSTNDNGDTNKLRVTLLDKSPDNSAKISAQVIRGLLGKNITDTNRKDTKPSPAATLAAGNATYEVRVNKTGKGVKKYQLDYRCLTSEGKWAGASISTVQNQ